MQTTPKAMRLHIALFGRTNVGKSSLLNAVAGQDVAITSPVPGTTTDVVEKSMELLPLGPVVFLDTAGLGDETDLGAARMERTRRVLNRADVVLLVCEPGMFTQHEDEVIQQARDRQLPLIIVINKVDLVPPEDVFVKKLQQKADGVLTCAATDAATRENLLNELKLLIGTVVSDDFRHPPPLVGDLLPPGGLAVLIVPIDLQAPKGRLILPQVQTIRDALDNDAATLVVKEREYTCMLDRLNHPPDLVICDSQVVLKMVADTPVDIPCTTFSILFARLKGDLQTLAKGAAAIDKLASGDRVLIAESCSHHALEDDIGRVKIPRWLRQYTGAALEIESCAGRDFPDTLSDYKLVIQCGGCMNNRAEMLSRLRRCAEAGVPVTNYGLAISQTQGVLKRALSPFPAALDAYEKIKNSESRVIRQ
ncbi:MAG: [FeFe] hydrogenase H-cluster maturation GTPase HydF [Lentisphaeria bacterium]|nr:[FeFe] hydrogenase H-cluster maturation GTPase HydF [Lentisphaeria bacterium]